MFLQLTWLVCCPLLFFHRTQFFLSRLGPRLQVFSQRVTIPGVGDFTSEQLQAISAWLQQPSPASNQVPNVRQLATAQLSTISDLPGPSQHSQGPAPSTGCDIYNLSNSMPLKLNSPDEHQLPMWFENTEILFRDAGVANERVMFNLFRGALTSSQANT